MINFCHLCKNLFWTRSKGKITDSKKRRPTKMFPVPLPCPTHKILVQLLLLQLMPQQMPSWMMLQRIYWMREVLQGTFYKKSLLFEAISRERGTLTASVSGYWKYLHQTSKFSW
ncbi:unnamed protein product, partial [Vitis vinifera]